MSMYSVSSSHNNNVPSSHKPGVKPTIDHRKQPGPKWDDRQASTDKPPANKRPKLEPHAAAGHGARQEQPAGAPSLLLKPPPMPPAAIPGSSAIRPERPQSSAAATDSTKRSKVTQQLLSYIDNFKFPFISDVHNYEKLAKIGQGTFGYVCYGPLQDCSFLARCSRRVARRPAATWH